MSIYRVNAKVERDMIIELNEQEIKRACIYYINESHNVGSLFNSPDDVTLSNDKNIDGHNVFVARIDCEGEDD